MKGIPNIEPFKKRCEELAQLMAQPNYYDDLREAAKVGREYQKLSELIEHYTALEKLYKDTQDNKVILEDSHAEPELKELAQVEVDESEKKIEDLRRQVLLFMLPPDSSDSRNTIIEIRAGAGGDEASLFAGVLYRMYCRFVERKNWKIEPMSSSPSECGGYREISFLVTGEDVYKTMKYESGVIEIPSFYASNEGISYYASNEKYKNEPSVTRDVSELITKLKKLGMEGLVLDLRYNGGGLLPEAITLTGLFIPIGPVVHVRNAEGQIREYIDTNPEMLWKGPLLILTSKFSASASEIFAGALKSYHRAFTVGDSTTHGKGTVQLLSEINRPMTLSLWSKNVPKMGATKFTVQKWYLPDGSSTQLKGVPSDILIPSINEHLPIAEADLSNPLPWDAIHTIPWTDESIENYADVVDNETLKKINKMSIDRQNSLEEFSFLKDTIEHFRKKRDQKEFSLNLASRKSERANDNEFTKNMEAWLDKLSTKKFELQDIRLNSAPSKPNANDNHLTDEESTSKTTLAKFDIYKREGLRIMSDYIELQSKKNPIKLQKEISE
ncbi:hypothetical protein AYO37_00740 [Opitutia bacterium SCGC AG-212-L18]|nr:hypothetical protein AYO37_00740 [Opitutae bacterium SCGC AG-212-L18]